jgi:(2Fe-2S) ferredoxin/cyclopropane fatty-acyl-phospholipid synthase-like methyltransferase
MEAYKYHVYVCNQEKPEGVPCCHARGSEKVIDRLRREIMTSGLGDEVQITTCGSIGLCEHGPNMIVYPEGIWYSGVSPDDIPEIIKTHFQSGKIVERLARKDVAAVREEIDTNKKKMMAAFKARDEAGTLPDDLMQKIRGFRESRIILSAIELDIFSVVKQVTTPEQIATKIGADPRATEMFLNALTAMKLLEKKDRKYYNTAVSSRYLVEGAHDDSRESIMHTVHLWVRWSTLTDCIKNGTSVTYKDPKYRSHESTTSFIAAMHKNATARAPMIAKIAGIDNIKRMLDVGGGSGAYSITFAKMNNEMESVILDLSQVTPIAQKHIADANLSDRIKTMNGDMRQDDFGNGFDFVLISAICHMNSSDQNRDLMKKAFSAITPGGRVVIQDFVLHQDKTSPYTAAIFALNMLVGTQAGSTYSEQEYTSWLNDAGFEDIKLIRIPGPTALVIAQKK